MKDRLKKLSIHVRNTLPHDFADIIGLTRRVYTGAVPWEKEQLASHLQVFPEGQLVAVDENEKVVGMASSLIIRWDDYRFDDSWKDFTAGGMFTNHDAVHGRTLYGAEVMVDPDCRSLGIGSLLYKARRVLVERLGLLRIRAGARLRGYGRHAQKMSATEYAHAVVRGELRDPTLSFQLKHGFKVLAVIPGYLKNDPESAGFAALIEWLNEKAELSPVPMPSHGRVACLGEVA